GFQVHVGEFVVGVAVENDEFYIALQGTLEYASCRERVHKVKKHTDTGHREAAHVLVAPVDGSVRPSNSLLSLKDPVACSLADIGELCDVVPEAKDPIANSL